MTTDKALEINFDCLVGPTHHFGGLSLGNLASTNNKARIGKPKIAALQGLKKMRFLAQKGFIQAILPPHERPHIRILRNLGFSGLDLDIIKEAIKFPDIFFKLCSSSFMWAANQATISPKIDSLDQKTHITPANLNTMFHRSIEHEFTNKIFKKIFAHEQFIIHDALIPHDLFSDEGAANHSRLTPSHSKKALQIFVYGKKTLLSSQKSQIYPARQSFMANEALARLHMLDPDYFLNLEQNPQAIDAGAFHNDVVAVANESVLLCHEMAFLDQKASLDLIKTRYQKLYEQDPIIIEIKNSDLPIEDTVSSYLFNSQLLTKPTGNMLLLAPTDSLNNKKARASLENIHQAQNPIDEIEFFDISESMANGGGPACLRLRIVLTKEELNLIKPTVLFSDKLFDDLSSIIEKYYVEELKPEYFLDPSFINNCRQALEEIARVLDLGSIYDFQQK
jgi:succinylarginine dihydrolase